jgi:hypothetical protein
MCYESSDAVSAMLSNFVAISGDDDHQEIFACFA